eukprot:m.46096 g.46096  ORF g.46096 m.46096 type:complete len:1283 (-) comp15339_c0_seq1:1083-4931(-)
MDMDGGDVTHGTHAATPIDVHATVEEVATLYLDLGFLRAAVALTEVVLELCQEGYHADRDGSDDGVLEWALRKYSPGRAAKHKAGGEGVLDINTLGQMLQKMLQPEIAPRLSPETDHDLLRNNIETLQRTRLAMAHHREPLPVPALLRGLRGVAQTLDDFARLKIPACEATMKCRSATAALNAMHTRVVSFRMRASKVDKVGTGTPIDMTMLPFDVLEKSELERLFLQRAFARVERTAKPIVCALQKAEKLAGDPDKTLDATNIVEVVRKSRNSKDEKHKASIKLRKMNGPPDWLGPKHEHSVLQARNALYHCRTAPPSSTVVAAQLDNLTRLLRAFGEHVEGDPAHDGFVALRRACAAAAEETQNEAEFLKRIYSGKYDGNDGPLTTTVPPPDQGAGRLRIPFKQAVSFVGRKELIGTAVSKLKSGRDSMVLLHGIPGVGKTVTAIEIVTHVEALLCCTVHSWLQANDAATVLSELEQFGRNTVHGIDETTDADVVFKRVREFLCSDQSPEWLFVLDDLTEEAVNTLKAKIPDFFSRGRVLATSRSDVVLKSLGPSTTPFELDVLLADEALDLLKNLLVGYGNSAPARRADVDQYIVGDEESERKLRDFLADEVGHLPITIATIARSIEVSGVTGEELAVELRKTMEAIRMEPLSALEGEYPDRRHVRGLLGSVRRLLEWTAKGAEQAATRPADAPVAREAVERVFSMLGLLPAVGTPDWLLVNAVQTVHARRVRQANPAATCLVALSQLAKSGLVNNDARLAVHQLVQKCARQIGHESSHLAAAATELGAGLDAEFQVFVNGSTRGGDKLHRTRVLIPVVFAFLRLVCGGDWAHTEKTTEAWTSAKRECLLLAAKLGALLSRTFPDTNSCVVYLTTQLSQGRESAARELIITAAGTAAGAEINRQVAATADGLVAIAVGLFLHSARAQLVPGMFETFCTDKTNSVAIGSFGFECWVKSICGVKSVPRDKDMAKVSTILELMYGYSITPTTGTFVTVIMAWGEQVKPDNRPQVQDNMMRVLDEMKRHKVDPDDLSVLVPLLNEIVGKISPQTGEEMVRRWVDRGVYLDVAVFRTLMFRIPPERANDVLELMRNAQVMADVSVFAPLITSWGKKKEPEKAEAVLQLMFKHGIKFASAIFPPVIVAWREVDNPDRAENVLEIMRSYDIQPNVTTFPPLISALGTTKGPEEILALMVKYNVKPNDTSFPPIVYAAGLRKNQAEILSVLDLMTGQGVSPTTSFFKALITALQSCKYPGVKAKVEELMRTFKVKTTVKLQSMLDRL